MLVNSFEFMVAARFLIKGRGQTLLIIAGIAAGVAVQFFLSSLIGGLQKTIIERTVGSSPHITASPAETTPRLLVAPRGAVVDSRKPLYSEQTEILSWQSYVNAFRDNANVTAASPVIGSGGFAERGGASVAVRLKGITFPAGGAIYKLQKNLVSGSLGITGNNTLVGKTVTDKLGLSAGDTLFLRNNKGRSDSFVVQGIFDLGSEQGNDLVFMPLDRARGFLDIDGVTSIEVQVRDVFTAEDIAQRYRREFPRITIESWQAENRELLDALRSQTISSNTIQFFVLFSISLGIASVLGIAAIQKSRELGILKAMGANNRSAALIFIYQGLLLGISGSIIGVFAGLGIGNLFVRFAGARFGLEVTPLTMLVPVLLAMFASVAASLIPARRAAGLSPIEVIRYG